MATKILLVGEAWGDREQKFKHALVGFSGAELARLLFESGVAPALHNKYPTEMDMIFHWGKLKTLGIETANVFNMHPSNNNIFEYFGPDGDRSFPAFKIGNKRGYILPHMWEEVKKLWKLIETTKPNLVVCMGNTACWAILQQCSISDIRGAIQKSPHLDCKVLPIFHPAALRDWSLRPIILADLQKALRESQFPEIRRIERWITCHDHINNIRITIDEINSWFDEKAQSFAIDIESGYALFTKAELRKMTPSMRTVLSSQISMVGFASSPNRAIVIPFMDRNLPNLSYWSDPNDETKAWEIMYERGLKSSAPKIFQNGMYDISRFLTHGLTLNNVTDDTMLHHHAMYPELLKSLGFLGSIYSNEISWKQMYGKHESYKRDE